MIGRQTAAIAFHDVHSVICFFWKKIWAAKNSYLFALFGRKARTVDDISNHVWGKQRLFLAVVFMWQL
jgi:hypothetical protein